MDSVIRSPLDPDNAAPELFCLARYRPNDSERKMGGRMPKYIPPGPDGIEYCNPIAVLDHAPAALTAPPDHQPEVLASMETLWSTLTRYAQTKPAIDAALARCREARAALDESIRALETL